MPSKTHILPRSVTMIDKLARLEEHFKSDHRVLIVINADPDAIASAMALKRLLWRKVASITITRTNEIKRPDNLAMIQLLKIKLLPFKEVVPSDYTRLALVDSQPHHQECLAGLNFEVVIDHHPVGKTTTPFFDVRPDFGATSTMMTEYLRAAKITPSRSLATALFYGIKTDTANFVRQGQIEDMRAFRFLFPHINQNIVRKIENSEITRAGLKYFQAALSRVKFRKDLAVVYLDRVDNPDTLVQMADFFMRVADVNRSVVAGLFKDQLVVIFRMAGPRYNAGRTAEAALGHFGPAGGHKSMARAEAPTANLNPKIFNKNGGVERFLLRQIS